MEVLRNFCKERVEEEDRENSSNNNEKKEKNKEVAYGVVWRVWKDASVSKIIDMQACGSQSKSPANK